MSIFQTSLTDRLNNTCPVCGKPRRRGPKTVNHDKCSKYLQQKYHGKPLDTAS